MTLPDDRRPPAPGAARPDLADRRREVIADVRHDLKNARLAAVCSLRELDELLHDARLRTALAGLEAAFGEFSLHAERGLELLSLGVDDIEPVPEPVALEPILREVETARRAAAEQAGIDLRTLPSGAVAVADPQLLARCVGNLLTNAIEHSGGSRALLAVRRRGAGCVIEVRDNGRGVEPDAVRGMDRRRWAAGSGRGLGLWIAGRFARLLGGELDVRSKAGRGSCFRVRLAGPVVWAPGSSRAALPGRVRFDGRVVVLLEGDAVQLQATRIAFERRGAKVIAARNRVEFWNEIEALSRPPDLCVLDLVIGSIGSASVEGATATTEGNLVWLKRRFGDHTRAVLLAAYGTHQTLEAIFDTPVIDKPLSDAKLDLLGALLSPS